MIQDLPTALADYRAGLDAALDLLSQLEALSGRQRTASSDPSLAPDHVEALVAERQHLLDALLRLETQLTPLRAHLATRAEAARATPGFQLVADRQRAAAEAVTRIMEADRASLEALQQADARRRADAQSVDAAGATLAAYRRVLEGPQGSAGLVDQRG